MGWEHKSYVVALIVISVLFFVLLVYVAFVIGITTFSYEWLFFRAAVIFKLFAHQNLKILPQFAIQVVQQEHQRYDLHHKFKLSDSEAREFCRTS